MFHQCLGMRIAPNRNNMFKVLLKIVLVVCILSAACLLWFYTASQAQMTGDIELAGLGKPVTVSFDAYAKSTIVAESKADAYLALGYLTARERLFQMDLMRRKMAGQLSEIIGEKALVFDVANRHLGFTKLAKEIVKRLPQHQRIILDAYAQGINNYLETMKVRPVEILALGYTPNRWRIEDSLLVSLAMFQLLNENQQDETMVSVMNAALPKDVLKFLTPDTDIHSADVLLQGREERHDLLALPIDSLRKLIAGHQVEPIYGLVDQRITHAGSNQWVVNKTEDGRAILANDMHLPLSVPGIWYQADLRYQDIRIKGITLPGLPLIIAGSNGSIAWGYTNAMADVLDLAQLTINPDNDQQYLTKDGWRNFEQIVETIKIKDAPDHKLTVNKTQWGPVSPVLLMGKPVAIQWSIYQPGAVNLDLMSMDITDGLDDALALFNGAGMPALNVMLADDQGQIAWILTGKIPKRINFDGSISVSRGQGDFRWQGFIDALDYPRVINPPSGFLMTANNRVLDKQHGFKYGHNFAHSYRAFRIKQWLSRQEHLSQQQLHELQLDTRSQLYEFYRQLALAVLTKQALKNSPILDDVNAALHNWDGHANSDSVGFGLLVKFREALADTLFSYYLQSAKIVDKNFRYRWYNMDTPLRSLLTARIPETLPKNYRDWDELILNVLQDVVGQIRQQHSDINLAKLTWGEMAKIDVAHPFGQMHPLLAQLLNMPTKPQTGCSYCVRVVNGNFGASMRLVVSPGYEDDMILVEPTGQSGNPLSPHYADQYDDWFSGQIPVHVPIKEQSTLILRPE